MVRRARPMRQLELPPLTVARSSVEGMTTLSAAFSIAASTAAVLALALAMSKSARRSRDEQSLRMALASTTDPNQKRVLESLHQRVVAEMVIRQVVPPSDFRKPIAFTIAATCLAMGWGHAIGMRSEPGVHGLAAGEHFALGLAVIASCAACAATWPRLRAERAHVRAEYLAGRASIRRADASRSITRPARATTFGVVLGLVLCGLLAGYLVSLTSRAAPAEDDPLAFALVWAGTAGLIIVVFGWNPAFGGKPELPAAHPSLPAGLELATAVAPATPHNLSLQTSGARRPRRNTGPPHHQGGPTE